MSDFAKIVRASDGAQVLFYKGQDDDGRPQLFQVTYFEGVIANLNFSFATDAWSMLDAAFDRAGLEQADTIRGLLGKFVPEPGDTAPSPNPIPNPAFGAPKPKNHNPKG